MAFDKYGLKLSGDHDSRLVELGLYASDDLRRLSDHANACIHAYRQKGMQVLNGKGHNSLAGIPAEWK